MSKKWDELTPEEQMKRLSRRGFMWAALAIGGTYGGFHWLHQQQPAGYDLADQGGVPWPFRKALELDDRVTSALYSPNRLSPTYTDAAITEARVNGDIGLNLEDQTDDADTTDTAPPDKKDPKNAKDSSSDADDSSDDSSDDSADNGTDSSDSAADDSSDTDSGFDPAKWTLTVIGGSNPKGTVLRIEDIKALPKYEFVTEFKCIEGWSFFMKWAGARFADFYDKYPPTGKPDYVALETPDGQYYVSIDMPSALHPQTLLCYEMNGKPLELEHGTPLRLIIPHKYGVKNIKRIGKITYAERPPKDYWAERGYDYYAGL